MFKGFLTGTKEDILAMRSAHEASNSIYSPNFEDQYGAPAMQSATEAPQIQSSRLIVVDGQIVPPSQQEPREEVMRHLQARSDELKVTLKNTKDHYEKLACHTARVAIRRLMTDRPVFIYPEDIEKKLPREDLYAIALKIARRRRVARHVRETLAAEAFLTAVLIINSDPDPQEDDPAVDPTSVTETISSCQN